MSLFKYCYYDSPDGKDLVKKLFYTNKMVTLFGFGLSASEIILVSKPIGYLNTAYRLGQLMVPMYAATSTFCIVNHIATHVRGKDDEYNYAISGFCAGALYGTLYKQKLIGMWIGVTCSIIGAAKKNSKLENYEFHPGFPEVRQSVHGDFRTPYRNWTLYDERPKGWIAAEERKQ